ncbi:MAG TPA: hypothetical protein VMS76_02935 [Planctomycetota bacterium]|nr:hypothetical protein [Planctomycetota bacterium]
MDVQDFVKETLLQFIRGVEAAQAEVSKGAVINPRLQVRANILAERESHNPVQTVEFDVALTVVEGSERGVGGGLAVMSFKAGGERKSQQSSESVSRVRFSVNLQLPLATGSSNPQPQPKLPAVKKQRFTDLRP